MIFTFRFFVEFIKERQVYFEDNLILDMGQILSLPFIVIGIYFILRAVNLKKLFWKSIYIFYDYILKFWDYGRIMIYASVPLS